MMQVCKFLKKNRCKDKYKIPQDREKYQIPLGCQIEPTPATTAAPSPLESEDVTTAPLRLLKNKFPGTVLCLISLNDPSVGQSLFLVR